MKVNEHVTVDALTEFLSPMGDEAKEIAVTLGQQGRQPLDMCA